MNLVVNIGYKNSSFLEKLKLLILMKIRIQKMKRTRMMMPQEKKTPGKKTKNYALRKMNKIKL